MYATILVPIDLSHIDGGLKAIKIAKELIDDDGKILLINVVEALPTYVEVELPLSLSNKFKQRALAELTKIANNTGIGSNVEIQTGHAAPIILDAAKEHKAGLIIVGSHRPGLADYFLGSTASRVVRHAQCPVFVDR